MMYAHAGDVNNMSNESRYPALALTNLGKIRRRKRRVGLWPLTLYAKLISVAWVRQTRLWNRLFSRVSADKARGWYQNHQRQAS